MLTCLFRRKIDSLGFYLNIKKQDIIDPELEMDIGNYIIKVLFNFTAITSHTYCSQQLYFILQDFFEVL